MAGTTYTFSGSLNLQLSLQDAFGGDESGAFKALLSKLITFSASGGTAPTLSGFWTTTITVASAQNLLLAHATNPTINWAQTTTYSPGFTVASSKLKLLIALADSGNGANTVKIARAAANGLPVFDTAGDSVTLSAGDMFLWYSQAGTAALTTGSNDALLVTPSAGSPLLQVFAGYGP